MESNSVMSRRHYVHTGPRGERNMGGVAVGKAGVKVMQEALHSCIKFSRKSILLKYEFGCDPSL